MRNPWLIPQSWKICSHMLAIRPWCLWPILLTSSKLFFNSSFWTLCSTRTTHCAVHFSHHYICSLGFLYLSLQTSNSCLAFLKVLWPEMSIWDFYGAVLSYQWSYKALEVRSLSYTMYSTLFGSIFKDWVRKLRVEFPKTWRFQVGFQVELTQDM